MDDSSFTSKADLTALETKVMSELAALDTRLTARQSAYETLCDADRKRLDTEIKTVLKEVQDVNAKLDGQNLILGRLDQLFKGILATPRNRLIAQSLFAAIMLYATYLITSHTPHP